MKEVVYVCENCGAESAKWSGRCNVCNEWNTLVEMKGITKKGKERGRQEYGKPLKLEEIELKGAERIKVNIGEFDRVLGGGIVPGSLLLLAGDPGIGKSTLLLMLAEKLNNVLYVSGEESLGQIKLRAERLNVKNDSLKLLSETDLLYITDLILKEKPKVVIIDSIQTMFDENFPSTPGSIVQVRESALKLQRIAKNSGIPIILVGHSTKDGNVAGPRTLEHLVDGVFYLEGEKTQGIRILRGIKNRFGATDEIGLFTMELNGLIEVDNPSALFLQDELKTPGTVVTAVIEGSRPILVEIQALTSSTVFGFPKRAASGYDINRLQLILAVLTNRLRLPLLNQDVYVNVAGGFQLKEPAADLAVACAVISALKNKSVKEKTCIFGELGLGGEIRTVSQSDKRAKEAKRLGYSNIISEKNIYDLVRNMWGDAK